ncbi:MAG: ribulose-phosphate 3-epimerase, partial [Candidatus Limnocylindria bacterium]
CSGSGGAHGIGVVNSGPQISASILNADFSRLGDEVRRAADGGVDAIHLDGMDGHFVDNLTFGPVVVSAVRPATDLPFHSHLMISNPIAYVERFADAGSDLIVFHVEADDEPSAVIEAIERAGKRPGIALNPETRAEAVWPFLDRVDLLLVMTVYPGWGGQAFIGGVIHKLSALAAEIRHRDLDLPIGVDGGVNLETIGRAHAAGADVLVTGSALYGTDGDLTSTVAALRSTARGHDDTEFDAERT